MMPQLSRQAMMDRDELIVRAFRRLYEPLCGYIRKRTGDIADIEDMVQDVSKRNAFVIGPDLDVHAIFQPPDFRLETQP